MRPDPILDPTALDLDNVLADRAALREVNPHRHEMEQVDAVVHLDGAAGTVAGYLDIAEDAFWARGHFPGYPLMPGVLMCEAAAQMCSYYITKFDVMPGKLIGLAGFDNVRFRAAVRPGDRLVLVGRAVRLNRRQSTFHCQGFVKDVMVFHADISALPILREGQA